MADTINLGSVYGKMELDTSEWQSSVDKAKAQLASIGTAADASATSATNSWKNMANGMKQLGTQLSVALTLPLVLFGKSSVDLAVEIETKWKEVQKVYGTTADAFMRDNKMLADSVDALTVKFGLQKTQTLDVLGALSAMGYEGKKAIDMLTQTIEFSTVGQMDLNEAMEGAVAISKIYNVEGDDLRKTLATLNTVENSTGATMKDLAEAVRMVGSSGNVAGVSIGELAGFMATLRERAIPAAEAANGLKSIFTRIYKVTDDAQKVYDKYNISIMESEKVTGSYTKTVGANASEIKRLSTHLSDLKEQYSDYQNKIKGVDLTEEKRTAKLKQLTVEMNNTSAAIQKNSGVTQTATGTYEKLTGGFKDADKILIDLAGSWQKMSDAEKFEVIQSNAMMYQKDKFVVLMEDLSRKNSTYVKTLEAIGNETQNVTTYEKEMAVFLETSKVKLAQNKAAWDNVRVTVGAVLLEAIVPLTTKLAEMAKWFSSLTPEVQRFAVGMGVLLAAIGPILVGVGNLITAVTTIKALLAGIGVITLPALGTALLVVGAAIAVVSAGFFLLSPQMQEIYNKTEAVKGANERLKVSQDNLTTSVNAAKNADLALTQAKIQEIETQKNEDAATKAFEELVRTKATPTTDAYKEAELRAQEAKLLHEQATYAVEAAEDSVIKKYTEANAKADEVKQKQKELQEANNSTENSFKRVADAIGNAISKLVEYAKQKAGTWYGMDIGRNAAGVQNYAGGWSMVGERGPELVYLPKGSDVYSNGDTKKMLQGGGNNTPAPASQNITFEVNVGMYAGSEMEKRNIAKELFDSLNQYLSLEGKSLAYQAGGQ